ncbi:MAG: hypothetical protein ABGX83_05450 [Nitrospira sp.]
MTIEDAVKDVSVESEIKRILQSPSVHTFCKNIILEGLEKDCVDAYHDAGLALVVLKDRMDRALGMKTRTIIN